MSIVRPGYLKWLIAMGIIEGVSTLVLFCVAMPLKYMYDMPMAVTITGAIHGVLFLALVAMFWIGKRRVPLPTRLVWWGSIGAVLPLVPFIVDIPLYRLLKASDSRAHAAQRHQSEP